jgi:hypothetical protein
MGLEKIWDLNFGVIELIHVLELAILLPRAGKVSGTNGWIFFG